jgi:hypothetical protein
MPGPVDEEERGGVGLADTPLVDYLKHVARLGAAVGAGAPGAASGIPAPTIAAPSAPVEQIGEADISGRRDPAFLCPGNLHAPF